MDCYQEHRKEGVSLANVFQYGENKARIQTYGNSRYDATLLVLIQEHYFKLNITTNTIIIITIIASITITIIISRLRIGIIGEPW